MLKTEVKFLSAKLIIIDLTSQEQGMWNYNEWQSTQ